VRRLVVLVAAMVISAAVIALGIAGFTYVPDGIRSTTLPSAMEGMKSVESASWVIWDQYGTAWPSADGKTIHGKEYAARDVFPGASGVSRKRSTDHKWMRVAKLVDTLEQPAKGVAIPTKAELAAFTHIAFFSADPPLSTGMLVLAEGATHAYIARGTNRAGKKIACLEISREVGVRRVRYRDIIAIDELTMVPIGHIGWRENWLQLLIRDAAGWMPWILIPLVVLFSVPMTTSIRLWITERHRFYRGRCLECGYSIKEMGFGIVRCPECGLEQWPRDVNDPTPEIRL
jgi:hypothetical protein